MTLYDQIKDDLLSKIKDGTYPEGQTIPSELELAEMYGVSRPTIRQALQILVSDGYLEKRRRRGTVVTKPKVSQSFTMSISSFEDAMRLAGRLPKTKVLVFKRERANAEVEKHLELTRDQDVFKLVRLRYADNLPNVFVESYIPCTLYPGLDSFDFNESSLYAAMDTCGNPVMTARRRLEVIKADGAAAALLDVEAGDPLLLFHTVARDANGTAVEYSVATYRGESNSFELNVSRV
ncbi:GntR family transcriptional regulator [Thermophilibacter provencensis]|uniref:GntR family transcriptional regulator n=1 Tax=Thermophilibacter provencensis TaxID=1852386 RepID=A0A921KL01_9ACTN|nr:GntR family transcriptional regulator [Thermophilibacter provencensis]HJF44813.1 GntR family transcriptional regulator [Thermophilibacter provencensis]